MADSSNLLQSGAEYLAAQAQAWMSVPVVYRRGTCRLPLRGVPGGKLLRTLDGPGGRILKSDLDLIVTAADLVLDYAVCEPRAGDRVEIVQAGQRHTYEVRPPFEGEPAWQHLPGGVQIRLHLTRVGVDRA